MNQQWILDVLNASCGDYLKGLVLSQTETGLQIDLNKLKLPLGMAEAAFAQAATRRPAPAPEEQRETRLPSAISKPMAPKQTPRAPVETEEDAAPSRPLPPMPASVRFQDVEPTAPEPTAEIPPQPLKVQEKAVEGEFTIEGDVYVTPNRAAELRGVSQGRISQMVSTLPWKHRFNPNYPTRKVFLKSDVMEGVKNA